MISDVVRKILIKIFSCWGQNIVCFRQTMKRKINFIVLFLCNVLIDYSLSQRIIDPVHIYQSTSYFWQVQQDYLIVHTPTEWNLWNLTNQKFLTKFPTDAGTSLSFDQSVIIDQDTLYIAHHNTNKVVVASLSNGSFTNIFYINKCSIPATGNPYYVKQDYIIIPCNQIEIVFIYKNNYTEARRFTPQYANVLGSIQLDEDAIFIGYRQSNDFYLLSKQNFDGNIIWETSYDYHST